MSGDRMVSCLLFRGVAGKDILNDFAGPRDVILKGSGPDVVEPEGWDVERVTGTEVDLRHSR
eukprot:CAMPEP_0185754854 /NCGR_PEP_ID=MMETSP1174-20130828/13440_1 /TAXON_ID=35687 /ORGANISM="Dictyocha speculum, Strain CCMP1381" /LENGTH=61 /DNA_ID=CAMNT_0028433229 /DNA_START=435 /DNA_END=620 /DNA_ORIENTATION=+